jgi:hypothetical protein
MLRALTDLTTRSSSRREADHYTVPQRQAPAVAVHDDTTAEYRFSTTVSILARLPRDGGAAAACGRKGKSRLHVELRTMPIWDSNARLSALALQISERRPQRVANTHGIGELLPPRGAGHVVRDGTCQGSSGNAAHAPPS